MAMSRQFAIDRARSVRAGFMLEFLNSAGPRPEEIARLRGTGRVTDNPAKRTTHDSHDESPTRRCFVMKYYVGLSAGDVQG